MNKKKILVSLLSCFLLSASVGVMTACQKTNETKEAEYYLPEDGTTTEVGVKLNETVVKIDLYDEYELSVITQGVTGNTVWTTTDPDIVTVENGKLYGAKIGTATVKVKIGEYFATCEVTVEKSLSAPVLKLDKEELKLEKDEAMTVTATLLWKNESVKNTLVEWSVEGENAESFSLTKTGNSVKVTGDTVGTTATLVCTAEYYGVTSVRRIPVTVYEKQTVAEYLISEIDLLPEKTENFTVDDVRKLATLKTVYNGLTVEEKAEISTEKQERLLEYIGKFSTAEWRIQIKENILYDGTTQGETVNGKPVYSMENVGNDTTLGSNLNLNDYGEVYFGIKTTGTDKSLGFINRSGAVKLSPYAWTYVKVCRCADGFALLISDKIDGEYDFVDASSSIGNANVPDNLFNLLKVYNLNTKEIAYWNVSTTGIYTTSVVPVLLAESKLLPSVDKTTFSDYEPSKKIYERLNLLQEGEESTIQTQVDKIRGVYAKSQELYETEIASWGEKIADSVFVDKWQKSTEEPCYNLEVYKALSRNSNSGIGRGFGIDGYSEIHFALKITDSAACNWMTGSSTQTIRIMPDIWNFVKFVKQDNVWKCYTCSEKETEYHEEEKISALLENYRSFDNILRFYNDGWSENSPYYSVYMTGVWGKEDTGILENIAKEMQSWGSKVAESPLVDGTKVNDFSYFDLYSKKGNNFVNEFGNGIALSDYTELRFVMKLSDTIACNVMTGDQDRTVKFSADTWYFIHLQKVEGVWKYYVRTPDEEEYHEEERLSELLKTNVSMSQILHFYNDGWTADAPFFTLYVSSVWGVMSQEFYEEMANESKSWGTKIADSALLDGTKKTEITAFDIYSTAGNNDRSSDENNPFGAFVPLDGYTEVNFAFLLTDTASCRWMTGDVSKTEDLQPNTWYFVSLKKENGGWKCYVKAGLGGEYTESTKMTALVSSITNLNEVMKFYNDLWSATENTITVFSTAVYAKS